MDDPWDQVTQLWPVNLLADPFGLVPLWLRMQWLWTEGAMLVQVSCQVWQGFLQHACLLASFPVGLYSDREPDSALYTGRNRHISAAADCLTDFSRLCFLKSLHLFLRAAIISERHSGQTRNYNLCSNKSKNQFWFKDTVSVFHYEKMQCCFLSPYVADTEVFDKTSSSHKAQPGALCSL